MYIFYNLAVQTWCSSNNLIHGLWPDYSSTAYPSFCAGLPFDLDLLKQSPKYGEISKYWYDCTQDETYSLYEHEWSKHGTCVAAQTGFTQNEYFEKALELFMANNDGGCYDLEFAPIDCLSVA